MSNEEGKEQQQLIPIAEYEVIEQRDDQTIVEMMTGQTIQEYVYSFRQGGRTVEGLTLAGINEAANRRGGIQVDDIQFEDRDSSWIVIAKATDTITGSSRYGAFEQSKKTGSRTDPFAFTKAVHKAQRNAIKQLIPVPVIKEVLNYYLHGKKPSFGSQPALEKKKQSKISNAQKAAFASAGKLKDKLDNKGISQKTFWTYVRRRYGVESRNDMTEMQWTQLAAELNAAGRDKDVFAQLVDRVNKLIAAVKGSEIPDQGEAESEELKSKAEPAQKNDPESKTSEDSPF